MPPVDASYEPGSANSFAKYYQDSAFNRNRLASEERANKLGDLQYGQEVDRENTSRALKSYFANKNPNDPDFEQGLGMIVGPQGVADFQKKQAEAKKTKLDLRVRQDEFTDKLRKNLSRNPSDANVIAWGEDGVIEGLFSEEEAKRNTQELLAMPPEERKKYLAPESEQPDPAEVATMRRLGFPMTPQGYAQFRDTQRQERLLSQEEEAQKIRIAGAGRAPSEPRDDPRLVVTNTFTDNEGNVTKTNKFGEVIGTPLVGIGKSKSADLSPTELKLVSDTDTLALTARNGLSALKEAKAENDKAYSGVLAGPRAALVDNVYSTEASRSTSIMQNLVGEQALANLKASFGGAPTEGERTFLLDLQASVNKEPRVRKRILERGEKLLEERIKAYETKSEQIRSGTYGKPKAAAAALSKEDAEALAWANQNPSDPRSAQIKAKLEGKK